MGCQFSAVCIVDMRVMQPQNPQLVPAYPNCNNNGMLFKSSVLMVCGDLNVWTCQEKARTDLWRWNRSTRTENRTRRKTFPRKKSLSCRES